MDALLVAGYRYTDLMGKKRKVCKLFAKRRTKKTLRGGPYTVAEITLNDKPANLTSQVKNGDTLSIIPAISGEDASPTIQDILHRARMGLW